MKLTNLNPKNLVKLCEMRLNHKKHNFVAIEEDMKLLPEFKKYKIINI